MIHVCSLSRLDETLAATGARRLVSLLEDAHRFSRDGFASEHHLFLPMHDIIEECEGMVAPCREHVSALLDFAYGWDRKAPLVIHCFAGISRSTAAAYVVAAALAPERDEAELAETLRRLAPSATPNIRLVSLADELLGRDGRMIEAVTRIGRGVVAPEGTPFCIPIGGVQPVSAAIL